MSYDDFNVTFTIVKQFEVNMQLLYCISHSF